MSKPILPGDSRDAAIAHIAREQLRAQEAAVNGPAGNAPGGESGSACPEPEIVAAYAERSLGAAEAEQFERHVAACGRCRRILTLVAVTGDEQTQSAEAVPGAVLAFPAAQRPAKPQSAPARWAKWWLVPALGAAAAVTLTFWIARRPASSPAQIVAQAPAVAPLSPSANAPAANSGAPQAESLQNELSRAKNSRDNAAAPNLVAPSPSSAPASPGVGPANAPVAELDAELRKQEAAPTSATTAAAPAEPQPARSFAAADSLSASTPPAAAAAGSAASAANSTEDANGVGSGTGNAGAGSARQTVTVTTEVPLLETERTEQAGNAASRAAAGGRLPLSAAQGLVTLACKARGLAGDGSRLFSFAGPGSGAAQWQAGAAGRIERSNDGGRTWQPQSSGVTSDLLAGAALSNQQAWIVGRGGAILHTTDGIAWQVIASPNGAATDWTSICIADVARVSITSVDGRTFRTADGGQTWLAQ